MTVSTLAEYRDRAEQVFRENPDAILGSLLWYSVTEEDNQPVRVRPADLETYFEAAGLDKGFLPPTISPVNPFRSITTAMKHTYRIDKHRIATLRVREVEYNDNVVIRHLLRDVLDNQDGGSHSVVKVATLRFLRGGNPANHGVDVQIHDELIEYDAQNEKTGRTFPLEELDRAEVEKALADFQKQFRIKCEFLGAQAIREMIRKVFLTTNAILAKKRGGVYFIHTDHQATVDAVQKVLKSIGGGCDLFQTPLFDLPDARELISDGLAKEIAHDVERIMIKIADLNDKYGSGKVPHKAFAEVSSQLHTAMDRVEDIVTRTNVAQHRAGSALELAQEAIAEMSLRIG